MKEGENKLLFLTYTKNSWVVFVFCNSRPLTKLSYFIACWNNFMRKYEIETELAEVVLRMASTGAISSLLSPNSLAKYLGS